MVSEADQVFTTSPNDEMKVFPKPDPRVTSHRERPQLALTPRELPPIARTVLSPNPFASGLEVTMAEQKSDRQMEPNIRQPY